MSIGILGKKLGMSQFFDEQGRAVPVTLIEAGPCRITQLKNDDTDGYSAVQIGFGETREKLINKPAQGHLNKSGEGLLRHLREYRVDSVEGLELGGAITVGDFEAGQKVDVSGDTVGRGFATPATLVDLATITSRIRQEPGVLGALSAEGDAQPGHLEQAAGDERRLGVDPELEPVAEARRQGDPPAARPPSCPPTRRARSTAGTCRPETRDTQTPP